MNISLRAIDKDNYRAVCRLPLPDEQYEHLSRNGMSILESHYEEGVSPRGIYLDDEPVGFIMWAQTSKTRVTICRDDVAELAFEIESVVGSQEFRSQKRITWRVIVFRCLNYFVNGYALNELKISTRSI